MCECRRRSLARMSAEFCLTVGGAVVAANSNIIKGGRHRQCRAAYGGMGGLARNLSATCTQEIPTTFRPAWTCPRHWHANLSAQKTVVFQ